jgi:apolipoprotein N-acyltransferase
MRDRLAAVSSDALARLRGAPRLALAGAAGAAATLAMPPFHAVPALWIAVPVVLWLLDGCRRRRDAALVGWAFGFGHFATGFFWIANAFYVDAETFGAFAVPAVGALSAAFGLYGSAAALAVRWFDPEIEAMPDDRVVALAFRGAAFAIAWSLAEWVRGWFLTGFPWNPVASTWSAWPAAIQVTAAIGTLGLSFLTVLSAALFAVLGPAPRLARAWWIATVPIMLLAAVAAGGALRLSGAAETMVAGVKLRLVQPNIPQADKWRPGLREQHLADYIALSRAAPAEGITHVIWGEAAVAFALDRDEARRRAAATIVPAGGALIAGIPRADRDEKGIDAIYNSLVVIDADAAVRAIYDKVHLVPFGEYMPLRALIPFRKLTEGTMDFSAGTARGAIAAPGLPPFSPLICYEAIFSGAVAAPAPDGTRPRWLLNATNDTWFGDSTGPHQHFAAARLRAVEEGLPLVRAATSGISAVIDAYGRVIARLELNRRGVLDAPLPAAPARRTLFSRTGPALPLALLLVSAIGLWQLARRRQGG